MKKGLGATVGAAKTLVKKFAPWPPAMRNYFSCVQRANLAPAGIWRGECGQAQMRWLEVTAIGPHLSHRLLEEQQHWACCNAVGGGEVPPQEAGRWKGAPQAGADKGPTLDLERPEIPLLLSHQVIGSFNTF